MNWEETEMGKHILRVVLQCWILQLNITDTIFKNYPKLQELNYQHKFDITDKLYKGETLYSWFQLPTQ